MKFFVSVAIRIMAVSSLFIPLAVFAVEPLDVMKAVDKVYRKSFLTAVVKTQLSTCKYESVNEKMNCKERPRITVVEAGEKRVAPDNLDAQSLAVILQPISDKGIGMLTYEYYNSSKDNDVWIYLPALGKVKRLISGNGNEDGGSFFGTEFFVDDVAIKKIDDYSYKILREEIFEDRPVSVMELVPTADRAKRTSYSKLVIWIDKERNLIIREDLYNRSGQLFKQRMNQNIVQVENVWVSKHQTMNNLLTRRITSIDNISVTYNKEVPDELLTQRGLTDLVFRENNLDKLRAFYK